MNYAREEKPCRPVGQRKMLSAHLPIFNMLLLVLMLITCNCSVIWKVSYFNINKTKDWKINRSYGKKPYSESDYFTFTMDGLKVTICPSYLDPNYPVLFGPPYLPIIPAFFFPHSASNDSIYSLSVITEIVDSFETSDSWSIKPKETTFYGDSKCSIPLKSCSIHFGTESPKCGYFIGGHVIEDVSLIDTKDSLSDGKKGILADDSIEISSKANLINYAFKIRTKDLCFLEINDFGIYKNGHKVILPKIMLLRKNSLIAHWITVGE